MTPPAEPEGLGELLRQARVAMGLSQESLARELRLPLRLLIAIEQEDWQQIPPGRERPLARLVAQKVDLDLDLHQGLFEELPGGVEQESADPKRESLERLLMGAISLGSIALLAWLVVPGRGLKSKIPVAEASKPLSPLAPYVPASPKHPFPVLGEVLPEAPINEEGIRVSLRAMDTCEAQIQSPLIVQKHSLRVSEPWSVRVKGPFTMSLDNAGVVEVEVAGHRIQHGKNVGEPWMGSFGADGALIPPPKPKLERPPTAPETEPEVGTESAE